MKEHNNIDAMFQHHFAETTAPISNQEALWDRIASGKQDKDRGIFWLLFLGALLIGSIGYTLIQYSNNFSIQSTTNSATAFNYQSPENNSSNIPAILPDLNNGEKDEVAEENNKNEKQVIATKNIDQEKPIVQRSKTPTLININAETRKITESITSTEKTIATVATVATEATVAIVVPTTNASNQSIKATQLIKTLDFDLLNQKDPKFNMADTDSWSRCEVKTPGHFFVDAYGQGGLPMDEITFSQAGSDQFAYRDLWEERFDPKASWHGGLQIGYEFPMGLRVSAGVEYQEIVTQYSDNQTITEMIRVWDPQAYFTFDTNGDRVWVGDTVTAINIYERRFVQKNKHTLINIPVQLSYDIYKKPSFHIAVDVAAALNISKSYEGQFIRSDQAIITIDDANQDNYMSSDIGVSLSGGLHFGYYKNDNLEFYLSPRFRYNPNSYLLNTETLKITRNILGLRGGIRYHF